MNKTMISMLKIKLNIERKNNNLKNQIVKKVNDISEKKITIEIIFFKLIIQTEFYDAQLHDASTKLDMQLKLQVSVYQ